MVEHKPLDKDIMNGHDNMMIDDDICHRLLAGFWIWIIIWLVDVEMAGRQDIWRETTIPIFDSTSIYLFHVESIRYLTLREATYLMTENLGHCHYDPSVK